MLRLFVECVIESTKLKFYMLVEVVEKNCNNGVSPWTKYSENVMKEV